MEKHYKSVPFKVPDGYFDSLTPKITKKINAVSSRDGVFLVPDNYFITLPKNIGINFPFAVEVKRKRQKRIRILHAAVIAILLYLNFWNVKPTPDYDLIQYAEEYYTYEADAYETASLAELETIEWINNKILDQIEHTNNNFREYPNPYDMENLNTYDDEDRNN